jgi:type II secretion system protein L
MSQNFWLLRETPTGYCIADGSGNLPPVQIEIGPQSAPEQTAEAIWRSFEERGYCGEPVLLALGSQGCLAATVPHTGRAMARNPQAMAFALEEFLPSAMEDIACDFVVFESDALGVAVEVTALGPLLSALEQMGLQVASITPGALLALQHQVKQNKRPARQTVIWQTDSAVELFELKKGRPHLWRTFQDDPESLARELKVSQVGGQPSSANSLLALGLSSKMLKDVCQACGEGAVVVEQPSLPSAMLKAAAAVLSGTEPPWIELRRGGLGQYDPYRPIRRSLKLCGFAVACLLVTLLAAAWIRADKYAAATDAFQQEQEDIFRQVFPGKSIPVGVRTRLTSEYQKLAVTKTQGDDSPRLESVVVLLHEALAALPENVRYRLLELDLESGQVRMEGELRQHGDADALAAGLRSRGFRVAAPHTEQQSDKGVTVTIVASSGGDQTSQPRAGE